MAALRTELDVDADEWARLDPRSVAGEWVEQRAAHLKRAQPRELGDEGQRAHVVDVTSLDRLYGAWRATLRGSLRTASGPPRSTLLTELFPEPGPVVTVHGAASHAMAWLGSALGVPCVPLGVDAFGQSGTVADLCGLHDLTAGSVVDAALAALELAGQRGSR